MAATFGVHAPGRDEKNSAVKRVLSLRPLPKITVQTCGTDDLRFTGQSLKQPSNLSRQRPVISTSKALKQSANARLQHRAAHRPKA